MTRPTLAVIGGGGFARETLAALAANSTNSLPWDIVGCVSIQEPEPQLLKPLGALWIGDDDTFLANPISSHYLIAISNPSIKKRLASLYDESRLRAATFIHPLAIIGPDVTIGEGSVIGAMAYITTHVKLGRHVHVDRLSTVGHDAVIEDFATLHPSSVVSGQVHVGVGVTIGTHASILQGRHVGASAVVGAGAVVASDVSSSTTVVGVPARPIAVQPREAS